MRQRHCAGVLPMMGKKETVASTVDEYIELGLNQKLRKELSEKIAVNKHLVYRDKTCIASLEDFHGTATKEMARNDYR